MVILQRSQSCVNDIKDCTKHSNKRKSNIRRSRSSSEFRNKQGENTEDSNDTYSGLNTSVQRSHQSHESIKSHGSRSCSPRNRKHQSEDKFISVNSLNHNTENWCNTYPKSKQSRNETKTTKQFANNNEFSESKLKDYKYTPSDFNKGLEIKHQSCEIIKSHGYRSCSPRNRIHQEFIKRTQSDDKFISVNSINHNTENSYNTYPKSKESRNKTKTPKHIGYNTEFSVGKLEESKDTLCDLTKGLQRKHQSCESIQSHGSHSCNSENRKHQELKNKTQSEDKFISLNSVNRNTENWCNTYLKSKQSRNETKTTKQIENNTAFSESKLEDCRVYLCDSEKRNQQSLRRSTYTIRGSKIYHDGIKKTLVKKFSTLKIYGSGQIGKKKQNLSNSKAEPQEPVCRKSSISELEVSLKTGTFNSNDIDTTNLENNIIQCKNSSERTNHTQSNIGATEESHKHLLKSFSEGKFRYQFKENINKSYLQCHSMIMKFEDQLEKVKIQRKLSDPLTLSNNLKWASQNTNELEQQRRTSLNILPSPIEIDFTHDDYLKYKKQVLSCKEALNYLHRISFNRTNKKIIMGIEQGQKDALSDILKSFTSHSIFSRKLTFEEIESVELAGDNEDKMFLSRMDEESGCELKPLKVFHGMALNSIARGKEIKTIESSLVKSISKTEITYKENIGEKKNPRNGTLGGIMRDKYTGKLYGITSQHTYSTKPDLSEKCHTICEMPVKLNDIINTFEMFHLSDEHIGYYENYKDAFIDLALIPLPPDIVSHPFCPFLEESNKEISIYKHEGTTEETSLVGRTVEHIGAVSGPTSGRIVNEDCDLIINKEPVGGKCFIVEGETKEFAFEGDSGSIVTGYTASGLQVYGVITAIEKRKSGVIRNRVWCISLECCINFIHERTGINLEFVTKEQTYENVLQNPLASKVGKVQEKLYSHPGNMEGMITDRNSHRRSYSYNKENYKIPVIYKLLIELNLVEVNY